MSIQNQVNHIAKHTSVFIAQEFIEWNLSFDDFLTQNNIPKLTEQKEEIIDMKKFLSICDKM